MQINARYINFKYFISVWVFVFVDPSSFYEVFQLTVHSTMNILNRARNGLKEDATLVECLTDNDSALSNSKKSFWYVIDPKSIVVRYLMSGFIFSKNEFFLWWSVKRKMILPFYFTSFLASCSAFSFSGISINEKLNNTISN